MVKPVAVGGAAEEPPTPFTPPMPPAPPRASIGPAPCVCSAAEGRCAVIVLLPSRAVVLLLLRAMVSVGPRAGGAAPAAVAPADGSPLRWPGCGLPGMPGARRAARRMEAQKEYQGLKYRRGTGKCRFEGGHQQRA
eukprot:1158314-Pelagomonas_calceolata.AAC.5